MCNGLETCENCVTDCGPCQEPKVVGGCVTAGHYTITMDGAPTSTQLDAFTAAAVSATFFISGDAARADNSTLARAVADGHTIGSASNNATLLPSWPESDYREVLNAAEAAISVGSCRRPRLLRPPQGQMTRLGVEAVARLGYVPITWSFDSHDTLSATTVASQVRGLNASLASVVHRMATGVTSTHINAVIQAARESGYTVVSMDRCLYGNTGALTPATTAYVARAFVCGMWCSVCGMWCVVCGAFFRLPLPPLPIPSPCLLLLSWAAVPCGRVACALRSAHI